MRRVISLITVLVLCLSVVCPAFATDTFVPSISDKGHPEINWPVMLLDDEGQVVGEIDEGCLIVTPVSEAETAEDIPEDAKKELLDVYKQLTDGTMTLPGDEDLVIRDLFDASLICTDDHKETLDQEGVYIELTFDLSIAAGVDVVVMAYVDGVWVPAHSVVNNGDGTVTVLLEDICPIAIAVHEDYYDVPAQTGDNSGILIWTVVMLLSAAALVVLLISRRKAAR